MIILHCLSPNVQVMWKIFRRNQRTDLGTRGMVKTLWITKAWVIASPSIMASMMSGSWFSFNHTFLQSRSTSNWGSSLNSIGSLLSLSSSWSSINVRLRDRLTYDRVTHIWILKHLNVVFWGLGSKTPQSLSASLAGSLVVLLAGDELGSARHVPRPLPPTTLALVDPLIVVSWLNMCWLCFVAFRASQYASSTSGSSTWLPHPKSEDAIPPYTIHPSAHHLWELHSLWPIGQTPQCILAPIYFLVAMIGVSDRGSL